MSDSVWAKNALEVIAHMSAKIKAAPAPEPMWAYLGESMAIDFAKRFTDGDEAKAFAWLAAHGSYQGDGVWLIGGTGAEKLEDR